MDLLNLNSKATVPEKVVKGLNNIYLLEKESYYQFMGERLKSKAQFEVNWRHHSMKQLGHV